jgi:hypothetical protein
VVVLDTEHFQTGTEAVSVVPPTVMLKEEDEEGEPVEYVAAASEPDNHHCGTGGEGGEVSS